MTKRITCQSSSFLLVVAVVGLTFLNFTLYDHHLQAIVGRKGTPLILKGPSVRTGKLGALDSHFSNTGSKDILPCKDIIARKIIQTALNGTLICPDSQAYNETVKVFNSRLKISPGVIIRPKQEEDILVAMEMAAKYGLVVTVKNGGHNPAGFSLNEGGLVIDMKFMDRIWKEDSSGDLIRSQGGAKWREVYKLMDGIGRSIVGGGCPTVGVAGLALGGGIGWMSRSRGLVSDNMLQARIVFPNATIGVIDDQNHPDLMWALRGAGGSNFGVVTEVLLQTYPAQEIYFAGLFCFKRSPHTFRNIIELLRDMINGKVKVDDRLTMDVLMNRVPPKANQGDQPQVEMCWAGFFDGPIDEALSTSNQLLDRLADLITEQDACQMTKNECKEQAVTSFAMRRSKEMVRSGQPWLQKHNFSSWENNFGGDYLDITWKSTMSEEFTEQMVDATVKYFSDIPVVQNDYGAKMTIEVLFEHLGGAMRKNRNSISAWKHGKAGIMASIQGYMWDPFSFTERGGDHHAVVLTYLKNWTESYYAAMSLSGQGSYGNYADADLSDWEEKYYGRENYDRLKQTKGKIPGATVFRSAQRVYVEGGAQEVVLPHFKQGLHDSKGSESILSHAHESFTKESAVSVTRSAHNTTSKKGAESDMRDRNDTKEFPTDVDVSAKDSSKEGSAQITNMASLNASSVSLESNMSRECPQELLDSMVPILPEEISHVDQAAGHDGSRLDVRWKEESRSLLMGKNRSTTGAKNILLTGGSGGLGWSATLHLAKLGFNVLYTSRTEEGCHTASTKMQVVRETLKLRGKMACVPLALDDFGSIRTFATRLSDSSEFQTWGSLFDVVTLNVGMLGEFGVASKAGNVSNSLAINHLGHFVLMHEMLNKNLIEPENGKVVVLGSCAMDSSNERDVESLLRVPAVAYQNSDPKASFLVSPPYLTYAAAKAINYMFANELSQRLASVGSGIMVGMAAPAGTSLTELTKKTGEEFLKVSKFISTAEGALATVFLASDGLTDGRVWVPGKVSVVSGCRIDDGISRIEFVQSEKLRCRVWDASLGMAGLASSTGAGDSPVVNAFVSPCKS